MKNRNAKLTPFAREEKRMEEKKTKQFSLGGIGGFPGIRMNILALALLFASPYTAYADPVDYSIIYVPAFRTYSAKEYGTSAKNVEFLKGLKQSIPALRIAGFGAKNPGNTSLICRMSFPVYLPGKVPFEAYLAEAMQAELYEADLYNETSPVAVMGRLNVMDFNSSGGTWTIEAEFPVEGKVPVAFRHVHRFDTSFFAVQACGNVTQALVPALQEFLLAVYSDEKFKELVSSATAVSAAADSVADVVPETSGVAPVQAPIGRQAN